MTAARQQAGWPGVARAQDPLADRQQGGELIAGPEHPDTLSTRHNLAYWAGQAGDAAPGELIQEPTGWAG